MKHPEPLEEAGLIIPSSARCRKWMGDALHERLARIRRNAGVDPNRYLPVENDIEYDITKILVGAQIAARETANIILPAILTARAQGWRPRVAAILRHPLLAALLTIAALISTGRHILIEFKADAASQKQHAVAAAQDRSDQLQNLTEAHRTELEYLRHQHAASEIRRSFNEAVGCAIFLHYQTMIHPKHITITIPESLIKRSGSRVTIELDHGLTSEEFATLRDQYRATKNTTLDK